LFLIS